MANNTKAEALVISAFVDSNNGRLYCQGDTFAGTAKQVSNLAARGYVDPDGCKTKEPEPAPEPPEQTPPAEEPQDEGVSLSDIKRKRQRRSAKESKEE